MINIINQNHFKHNLYSLKHNLNTILTKSRVFLLKNTYAIGAVSLSSKLDVIVLVSGDGDFVDLVYHLKSKGIFVEIISFPESTQDDLIKSADLHIPIDNSLLIKSRKK